MDFATPNEQTATGQWLSALQKVMTMGVQRSPRDIATMDMVHATTKIDMSLPIVGVGRRELGYRFLAAEPHWILTGDSRLSHICARAPQMEKFSDDGVYLRGAYGPKIVDQLPYVVECLANDKHSRQAVLTIWRERPGPSKDIPCTVAMQFRLLGQELYTSVFMRSSDLWLGWPYDLFTFTCVTQAVSLLLKTVHNVYAHPKVLSVTAGSLHIYRHDEEKVKAVLDEGRGSNVLVNWDEHIDLDHLLNDLKEVTNGNYTIGPVGAALYELHHIHGLGRGRQR